MELNERDLSGYSTYRESIIHPRISNNQYREIRDYAMSRGISISDFKDYTGQVEDVKDILNKICIVARDFPMITNNRHQIVLGLRFEDSKAFAGSEKNKITLNGLRYDNTIKMSQDYQELVDARHFVSGTTWRDVVFHELGHIVCYFYKIDPLKIAKKILRTESSNEVAYFVSENLSIYSGTAFETMVGNRMMFDGTEIIAEAFCAHYSGVKNDFAEAFYKECLEYCKEVGV